MKGYDTDDQSWSVICRSSATNAPPGESGIVPMEDGSSEDNFAQYILSLIFLMVYKNKINCLFLYFLVIYSIILLLPIVIIIQWRNSPLGAKACQ